MFTRVRAAASHSRRWSAQRLAATSLTARPLSIRIGPHGPAQRTSSSVSSASHTRGMATQSTIAGASLDNTRPPPTSVKLNSLPSKVLIANRGEIACRVIRTCRRLGIRTVAVYSEADARAAHALLADEAYCIGPAPSAESYLQMDRIIDVCKQSGAQMVHPGYGFLSENAEFSRRLDEAGIKFIGPPSSAIISMGSKSASKEIMTQAGVPCVPGYHGNDQSDANLQNEAAKVGYPILIKAVKGGGGKGMKIVTNEGEFLEQLQSARREAITSFGDGDVLIERYLTKPRHVEVQVVSSGAPFNEHVAISTRDCSVQRRHQKIIEEAPAPHLSPDVERDLCEKATAAVRAVNYEGAGTVEFILDADSNEAWFLECNTRLQVEHPVSEMVSGIDLVEWQLEVAAGNPLPMRQEDITKRGHAFEARIYAEDTRANFLPDVGHLSHVAFPAATTTLLSPPPLPSTSSTSTEGLASVRVDTGVATGDEVSVYYDPMIAKVIVHGRDRQEALRLMRVALQQTHIVGPKTNVDFLQQLCKHRAFIDGSGLETGFIKKYIDDLHPAVDSSALPQPRAAVQAALYLAFSDANTSSSSISSSPWHTADFSSFRLSPTQLPKTEYILRRRAKRQTTGLDASSDVAADEESVASLGVTITKLNHLPGRFDVSIASEHVGTYDVTMTADGQHLLIEPVVLPGTDYSSPPARQQVKIITRPAAPSGPSSTLMRLDLFDEQVNGDEHVELDVVAPTWLKEVKGAKAVARGSVMAPMPSKVVDVRVSVGQEVQEGEVVVVLEAMKTEHTLRAPKAGKVKKITVEKGAMCAEGTELVLFEEEEIDKDQK